ncbi:MAG: hypothetical protein K2H22_00580 [Muribaculaceae bacterium]|nr:hypothetical protein [Muribaculaceae bacterium]
MKKFITLSVALAICAPVFADSLQILKCTEDGIPGMSPNEPQLMGFSMSANGQYVCGAVEQAAGIFVANCLTGEVKWQMSEEYGGELRGVDNNGMAIGFLDDGGVLFPIDGGDLSFIKAPSGIRYVQGEGLSNDGSVKVGVFTTQSFDTKAAYSLDGEVWKELPYPSDSELGNLKDFLSGFSAAKFVSGDGNVILGYLGSFTLPVLWTRNSTGEYVTDFYAERFVKAVEADRNDETKELYALSGMYICMSHNGKYVGTVGLIANDENNGTRPVPVIYNTEDKTIKIYKEKQAIDDLELGLYPRAIADDGTFIGTVYQPSLPEGNYGAFIMRAGEEQAESFLEAFPAFNEKLGESDLLGQNIPTGISADGKHILGYTYYSEDFDPSSPAPAYFLTYVISLDETGVESVESAVQYIPESVYSIDGRKLGRMTKGLNIIRNADGTTRKIMIK